MKETHHLPLAYKNSRMSKAAKALAVALCLGGITAACSPLRDHRGYVISKERVQQVDVGSTKSDVETALGSPSATSTIDGQTYYYISSTVEQNLFFAPKITDRKIIAVHFDETETVSKIANYGLKDGVIFDFISRKTPTRGKELTLLQQMFGNLGKFNPTKGTPGVSKRGL